MKLELRDVSKSYRGIAAIEDVSFEALAGEVTGYLGPNGSGKSTTLKIVAGLIDPTSGHVFFDGQPILAARDSFKQRVGYVPEEPNLYSHLSGLEYLQLVADLRDLPAAPAAQRIDGLLSLLGLHSDRNVPISAYSKGMRQKVLLCAALLHNPDLLLLDEPFSGLDAGTGLVLRRLIGELAARGKVILFSSHELETVEKICRHAIILHKGRVVADGSIESLRERMLAPNLESVFEQLAVEVDAGSVARQIAGLIGA